MTVDRAIYNRSLWEAVDNSSDRVVVFFVITRYIIAAIANTNETIWAYIQITSGFNAGFVKVIKILDKDHKSATTSAYSGDIYSEREITKKYKKNKKVQELVLFTHKTYNTYKTTRPVIYRLSNSEASSLSISGISEWASAIKS